MCVGNEVRRGKERQLTSASSEVAAPVRASFMWRRYGAASEELMSHLRVRASLVEGGDTHGAHCATRGYSPTSLRHLMTASDCHARHRQQSHTCAFALHLLRLVEGGDTHVRTAQAAARDGTVPSDQMFTSRV